MSEVVEELLHKHGLLERPRKPRMVEGEVISRYRWRVLRDCIRNIADQVSREDIKEKRVSHGLQNVRKMNHTRVIKQVMYIRTRDEYLTLDGESIRLFHGDGRLKDLLVQDVPFGRLVYADQVNQFVGWSPGSKVLVLLTPDTFQTITESATTSGLDQVLYNEDTGEIVSSEAGCLTAWVFRYGNRHLLPKRRIYEGLQLPDNYPEHRLTLMALERTPSRSQRLYCVFGQEVRVFNLFDAVCLSTHKDLHVREITAITFFNPLKLLVTGAQDGSIKVWDEAFFVKMVFVGHNDAVTYLDVYPFGPNVVSASKDRTLRVWSLEIDDEVDKVRLDDTAIGLGSTVGREVFHSVSPNWVELWRVNLVHVLHTTTNAPVLRLCMSGQPDYPRRALVGCRDGMVHLVVPNTGEVVTTAVCSTTKPFLDSCYVAEDSSLFALFKDGSIEKYCTDTNPCTLVARWPAQPPSQRATHIVAYEYIIKDSAELSPDMKRRSRSARAVAESGLHGNKTLLIASRYDGHLAVLNRDTGEVDFEIEGHGTHAVVCLVAHVRYNQVISAGEDNVIKIWRVYPYAKESLAPMTSFFCANAPLQLAIFKHNLIVCFEDPNTAIYTTVLYNLESKNRFDHSPEDDHMDSFTAISCCPRLKLFVTASMDGTLRIWDEKNRLVRTLHLHEPPLSVEFCSEKGDILVGLGRQLYYIDHIKYLPKLYLRKMVMMVFDEAKADTLLHYDPLLLQRMKDDEMRRLKAVHAAFKFASYQDIISQEETEVMQGEKRKREKAYSVLAQREQELQQIRDGELKASRKAVTSKKTKSTAFERYLKLFYDRPGIQLPPDPPTEEEMEVARQKAAEKPPEWMPEAVKDFFPPISAAKFSADFITPAGYVPNSVLVKLLWPPEVLKAQIDTWKPPEITAREIEMFEAVKPPEVVEEFEDEVMIFDWGDDEKTEDIEEKEPEEDTDLFGLEKEKKKIEMKKAKPPPEADAMDKMQKMLAKAPPPREDIKPPTPEEEPQETPKTSPRKSPSKRLTADDISQMRKPKGPERVREVTSPEIKIRRPPDRRPLVKKEEVKAELEVKSSKSPESISSSTKRPRTPLPDFVAQFKGEPWFEESFPGAHPSHFPQPLTPNSFCSIIILFIRTFEDLKWREMVFKAIVNLYTMEGLSQQTINSAKRAALDTLENPPDITDRAQRTYLEAALKLLVSLGLKDKDSVLELIMWYFEGNTKIQRLVMELLTHMGRTDPANYLPKELDSWDLLTVGETTRRRDLRKVINAWLDKWLTNFKVHIVDTVERLTKGEQVIGELKKKSGSPLARRKSILKREASEQELQKLSKVLTVQFDNVPDKSIAETATCIDAINYFCEVQHQEKISRLRRARRGGGEDEEGGREEGPKNTVLVLPQLSRGRQCLVRLGESHTDAVRRRKEEWASPLVTHDCTQPASMQPLRNYQSAVGGGFAPLLHLPMKPVLLNPFPNVQDILEWEAVQPVMISLKASQKYFVPALSCPPQPF